MRRPSLPLLACLALGLGTARAEPVHQDAFWSPQDLTPKGIYERALRNLMESAILDLDLLSVDGGGNQQDFRVEMMWRRYPEGTSEAAEGILSRAVARYLEPRDLRQAGVLVINRRDGVDDQYVYLRSSRRIRRLNLSGQNVFGTDFAVEDLVPRGLFHARYERRDDAEVEGAACFTIEARFVKGAEDHYSRALFYVEKLRFVPLLVRYWDRVGVEVKQLRVSRDAIREIEGLHVPLEMTIHSLKHASYTALRVTRLVTNPPLPASYFSLRHLEQHATSGIPRRYYRGAHDFALD